MDLIGGYLLIMLALFAANIALLIGNYKIDNVKLVIVSAVSFIITFLLMHISNYLNMPLLDYFGFLFLIIAIALFVIMLLCAKNNDVKVSLYSVSILCAISVVLASSQSTFDLLDMILYSLCVFIVLFVVCQLSKLLHHAKRQYPVIIGEYMCLFSLLMFLFALTYNSTRALDYSSFSPFLILTPTYKLIYVVIGIVVVLVIGVLINDKGGNS